MLFKKSILATRVLAAASRKLHAELQQFLSRELYLGPTWPVTQHFGCSCAFGAQQQAVVGGDGETAAALHQPVCWQLTRPFSIHTASSSGEN